VAGPATLGVTALRPWLAQASFRLLLTIFGLATDLLLHPPLASIDLLDWRAFDRVVQIGYQHAIESIEKYRAQLASARGAAASAAALAGAAANPP